MQSKLFFQHEISGAKRTRGIYTSSTQVRENQTQNVLEHSNAKATTFMFNMLYIVYDFPLFPYFSLTFSCYAFSISKNINLHFSYSILCIFLIV